MLNPLPDIMKDDFDKDSLVYISDTEMCYAEDFPKDIIDDIQNHNLQIYSGYYLNPTRGTKESPRIFLIGRGKKSGKFKFKIQGFQPYCYIKDKDGEFKDNFGNKLEKIVFVGMEPRMVATFRDRRRGLGYPQPYEADILFVRRILIDMYNFFKSTEPIQPKIAILDIETDHPVSENIISFAINDMEGPIIFESKFDTKYPSELALDLLEHLERYDLVTGWNISFDIDALEKELHEIDKLLTYAENRYMYSKEEYINNLLKSKRKYDKEELINLIELLINRSYLKEVNGIIELGEKGFHKRISHFMAILDLLPISRKMRAVEIKGKWSLGNVGVQLAGIDKYHIGAIKIRDLNEDELLEYNCLDVIIPDIIDNILGGLDAHIILSWALQALIDEREIVEPAVINDIALLRAYHKAGIVLPSRDFIEKKEKEPKYDAADPDAIPGIYDGLIITDLVHAYPWAVISRNISCETKDPNGIHIVKWKSKDGIDKEVRFNDNKSIFIETLKEIMNERKKIKSQLFSTPTDSIENKRLKSIDFALKTQAAAFSHGIFGWANSRMRDYEVADAITAIVRNLISIIKDACGAIERAWVYVHTDSAYINAPKSEANNIVEYLNEILADYSEDALVMPNLENKGYKPIAYIHSPARNVLIPENGTIDDDLSWEVTGMNFMRSETPEELADIEVEIIKMKMKKISDEDIKIELKNRIKNIINIDSTKLGLIKPITKPLKEYGKELKDGTHGNIPAHIKALLRAHEEYGFEINIGDKYMVIPIISDEVTGKKKLRRKRIDIAFSIDEGLPNIYKVDYEYYLRSNLWGKIKDLFGMTAKDLEKTIIDDEMRKLFGLEEFDKKLKGGDLNV